MVTRKLTAVITALVLAAGVAGASALAGSGSGRNTVPADGVLRTMSRDQLPFRLPAEPAAIREQAEAPAVTTEANAHVTLEQALAGGTPLEVVVTTSRDPVAVQRQAGVSGTTYRRALQGFSARLTPTQIRQLQAMPGVESIVVDEPVRATLDNANRWTGAAAARSGFGLTGDGDGLLASYSTDDVVIAVIDTGIDSAHRDLAGKVLGWKDLVNDKAEPYDDHGHGTHVAGIAAGAGVPNPAMRGVAPGAALVGVKVLDAEGAASTSRVIDGVEWVLEHKDEYNIKVLKIGMGQVLL